MEEFGTFLVDECSPLKRRIVANIAVLLDAVEKQNAQASQAAIAQERSAVAWIIGVSIAALITALVVTVLITHTLLRQLGGDPALALTAAERIASGNLQVQINAGAARSDSLMGAMKLMHNNLHEIVSKVRTGSDSIYSASSEIAAGNLDLSSRTEAQAAALEKVSSSMKQLIESVGQNAADADSACSIANNATLVSEEGGKAVARVVQTMADINSSSKKIEEIVGVIDGIAFQTNILALNAAVEAARAGEQGRGFAVVASEVRNLAQRSAAAAKEVKSLIAESVQKVRDGTAFVEQAGSTMSSVVTEIQRVSSLRGHISSAAKEQYSCIEKIDKDIVQFDDTTQQNAALVEEAAAAAGALQEQAARLTETVLIFKLDHAGIESAHVRRPAALPLLIASA